MADGELNARDAERVVWDVIVVGTGMGGGMLGYSLARSGRRVLFVEKGRSTLPGAPGTIRSAMPEVAEPLAGRSAETYYDALARAGRSTDEIEDISGRFSRRFVPFLGSGTGGSSAIYGMVCERFFVRDFTPRQDFRDPGDSTVPEAWPITYDQMRPWYAAAEKLLGVRGEPDPLRPEAADVDLPAAPPFSADNQPLVDYLTGRGLHPYHLPMACDYTDGCTTCQGYLCHQSCKNDAARNCLLPAVAEHGAHLLSECRVVRLDADRTQVRHVICEHRSGTLTLKAKVVVLAAGALVTPVLLLNSRSGDWPRGLANGSDWVGRNLMRHLMDLIEIWPQPGSKITAAKQGDRAERFLFLGGAEIRHRAVIRRDAAHGGADQPPRLAAEGAAPDEPGGAPQSTSGSSTADWCWHRSWKTCPIWTTASCHAIGQAWTVASGCEFSIVFTPVRSSAAQCFCGS